MAKRTTVKVERDSWGDWTVNAGYYGLVDDSRTTFATEKTTPNTRASALAIKKLAPQIIAGIVAASGKPNSHVRLRATRTDTGWAFTEYDWGRWTFEVAS